MKPFPNNPLLFLWIYARKNLKLFLTICFCVILSAFNAKLVPYLFSRMVGLFGENVQFEDIQSSIWFLLCCIVGATILKELFFLGMQFLTESRFRPLVFQQMSYDTFVYINGHSEEYFANNLAGSLGKQAYDLSQNCSQFFIALIYYILFVAHFIVAIVFLFWADSFFALCFLMITLLSSYYWFKRGFTLLQFRQNMVEIGNLISGSTIDTLQNNFFVRIFNAFKHEEKKAQKDFKQRSDAFLRYINTKNILSTEQQIYFQIVQILFVAYALYLWKYESLATADFVLIFMLLSSVFDSIIFLIQRTFIYFSELTHIKTDLEPFTIPHDIQDSKDAPNIKVSKGEIDLKNITFAYKNSKTIFQNFNLKIKENEKVGIVGMSGGGKSTLIKLLLRFYDLKSGEILIDKQNIAKVTQDSLHKAISYIPQTSEFLERSIAANIAYGNPSATPDEIKQAAKEAYADEFIEELPNKYKTLLNDDNKLSGGQIQRIAIARALLKNSKILILDEATSSLDSKSEFYIQKAIDKIIANKTVIAIAHRLSTLKNMDRIIVIEKGKIVEDGTLDALLKKHGKFYQYWEEQKLKELDDEK